MKAATRSYLDASQKARTVIRHITCKQGFCLIAEKDEMHASLLSCMLEHAKLRSMIATNVEDAITILHEDGDNVICAVIDYYLNGSGNGLDVIREIEHRHSSIPYVVHTDSLKAASEVTGRFPNANVILKGQDLMRLLDALGVSA